jgi:hypothetical protein
MRHKRHYDRGAVNAFGLFNYLTEKGLVPYVNPVEVARGHHGILKRAGDFF